MTLQKLRGGGRQGLFIYCTPLKDRNQWHEQLNGRKGKFLTTNVVDHMFKSLVPLAKASGQK